MNSKRNLYEETYHAINGIHKLSVEVEDVRSEGHEGLERAGFKV